MPLERAKKDECFILVKAQPHRSSKYFETVCCAGIGRNGKWRRQYPVPFRILDGSQKFNRWEWIEYSFVRSDVDKRLESQKVQPESLKLGSKLKKSERARLLNPLIRRSFLEADSKNEFLVLLRPQKIRIDWEEKSEVELREEREKHELLAQQMSMFDKTAKPLVPCPIQFFVHWTDEDGKNRRHECDDWETASAFRRFEKDYGRRKALSILQEKYEDQYFEAGLALAFSTHSRRNATFVIPNQWLLVGLIRLDEEPQQDLFL